MRILGIRGEFAPTGSAAFLLDHFGLTADGIADAVAARSLDGAAPERVLLAIDQGTSATKALLVDADGAIVARGAAPVGQAHPQPGLGRAVAGRRSGRASARRSRSASPAATHAAWPPSGSAPSASRSCSGTARTGAPLGPLLSWQDQRTAPRCARLRDDGRRRRSCASVSGLPLDPMFSALKAGWLLDAHDPDRTPQPSAASSASARSTRGCSSRLGGDHVIEVGNAARTQLLDVRQRALGRASCSSVFGVPEQALPAVVSSTGPFPAVARPAAAAGRDAGRAP